MDNEKSPQTPSPRPPNEGQPHEVQGIYFSAQPPKGEGVVMELEEEKASGFADLAHKGSWVGRGESEARAHPSRLLTGVGCSRKPPTTFVLFTNKTIPFPTDKWDTQWCVRENQELQLICLMFSFSEPNCDPGQYSIPSCSSWKEREPGVGRAPGHGPGLEKHSSDSHQKERQLSCQDSGRLAHRAVDTEGYTYDQEVSPESGR